MADQFNAPGRDVTVTWSWSEDSAIVTITDGRSRIGRLWLDRSVVGDLLASAANQPASWEVPDART